MKTDIRYAPSDVFDTFPFPEALATVDLPAESYRAIRKEIMLSKRIGLTETYNRFHDQAEDADCFMELRPLHAALDMAVAAAYGWDDVVLEHGFHETRHGIRFTISEAARREVLDRLLALNHQRHAEEGAAAATQPSANSTKRGRKKKDSGGQSALDF